MGDLTVHKSTAARFSRLLWCQAVFRKWCFGLPRISNFSAWAPALIWPLWSWWLPYPWKNHPACTFSREEKFWSRLFSIQESAQQAMIDGAQSVKIDPIIYSYQICNPPPKQVLSFHHFYRHVLLPKEVAAQVPLMHLMTETEWRNLGVQQSPGWVHYMMHDPGMLYAPALASSLVLEFRNLTCQFYGNIITAMTGSDQCKTSSHTVMKFKGVPPFLSKSSETESCVGSLCEWLHCEAKSLTLFLFPASRPDSLHGLWPAWFGKI